ncbi:UMP-CMP kinase 2, mitochondrial-like [Harmonia axyridis]|uniref:UMP-CMP kinase 2, mitochondrial-like n=1 Tax=Harmonia axyridis TaxID=115357 RepID=UPI001E275098|nr:UMP-CMP kinase 2, mitochondrial-like [Harmonia axyridis]
MLSALVRYLGNYRLGIIIIKELKPYGYSKYAKRYYHNKMFGEGVELPEKDEPKRPPYKCGSFNSKFKKAEKTVEYFNRSRTSLDSILNLFEEHKDKEAQISYLLETYKDIREKYSMEVGNKKNYPLIVLEGLDGSGKSTLSKQLAKNLGAEWISTPPKSLISIRDKFDDPFHWRSPFYYFCNYVAAIDVTKALKTKPVVMDRFWHSTTAYALAQMKENYYDVMKSTELPEKGSDVYEWPTDLLKPDIIIYLDVSENMRIQRLSRRASKTDQENLLEAKQEFRKNVVQAYENMANPGIFKVNGDPSFKNVLENVTAKVKELF